MSLRRRQRVLAAERRHTWSSTFDSSTMTSEAVFGSFSSSSISGLIVVSSACLSSAAATVAPTTPSLSEGSLGCARFKMVRGSLKLCMISGLDVHAAGKKSKTESARRYCNDAGKISASLASSGRSIIQFCGRRRNADQAGRRCGAGGTGVAGRIYRAAVRILLSTIS